MKSNLTIPLALTCITFITCSVRSQITNVIITEADITRAVQISASVQALSANTLKSARDQAWLSFMNEFYARNPNTPANLLTSAYAYYTNEFNNLVASASATITIPSQAQLLDMIVHAGSQVPGISNNVAYAVAAVQQAAQAAQMASLAVQNAASATSQATAELTSAMQLAANQFVAVPAQTQWNELETKALNLADANPQFRNAYQNVIAPITQIAPGASLSQILQNLPSLQNNVTLSTLLNNLDKNGILQNPIGMIASSFNNQVNQVSSAINNTMTSVQDIIQQEIPKLPDYLQTTLLPDPGNLNLDLQRSTSQLLQSASTSFNMLSDLMGPIDANLSKQIGTVGQFATTLGNAANSFSGDVQALTGAIADFSSGNILGSISGVFSMFGGGGLFGGGPSPAEQELLQQNQQILQGEQEILLGEGTILTNIARMQQDMDMQFSNVDQSLNTIYSGLETGFFDINSNMNVAFEGESNQISEVFSSLSYQLEGINSALLQQQIGQDTFEQNVYSYAVANESDTFSLDVNNFLGYEATYGHPMPSSVFGGVGGAQPTFFTWATTYAQDAVQSPGNCGNPTSLGQTFSDVDANNKGDPSACLNCINVFLTEYLNLPSISGTSPSIPNPHVWAMSANAYIQLMRENPALFQGSPGLTNNVQTIIANGENIQSAIATITYTNSVGINWPLWKASFQYYRQQIALLANSLYESETNYESVLSLDNPLIVTSNLDIIHETHFVHVVVSGLPASFGAIVPASTGGVRGLAQNEDGSYTVYHISPDGALTSEITIPVAPLLDGSSLLTALYPYRNYFISSFITTPGGQCYITIGETNYSGGGTYTAPIGRILSVDTNGNFTTIVDAYPTSQSLIDQGFLPTSDFGNPAIVGLSGSSIYVWDTSQYGGGPGLCSLQPDPYISGQWDVSTISPGYNYDGYPTSFDAFEYSSLGYPNSYSMVNRISASSDGANIYLPKDSSSISYGSGWGGLVNLDISSETESNITGLDPSLSFVSSAGSSVAYGPDGNVWVYSTASSDMGDAILATYTPNSGSINQVYFGYLAPTNDTLPTLQDGSLSDVELGYHVPYPQMCVDSFNDLYMILDHNGVNNLVCIGTPWRLQRDLFTRWADDLSQPGTAPLADLPLVTTALPSLDVAKSLIRDLVTFGLSQSFAQDDVMHSLLNGPNGLLDTTRAGTLVNSQLAALAVAPVRPVLDLPTLASNRLDALWCQIVPHLLDVQSRAAIPADGLVFDLLITNGQAEDISFSANPVALLQASQFTNSGVAEQSSLVCNGAGGISVTNQSDLSFHSNTDFTISFWTCMASQGDVYVGSAPESAQTGASWWLDFNNGWALTSQLQPDAGTNVVLAPYFATNFVANQTSAWFYITMVVTRAGGIAEYYVDGLKVGQNMIPNGTGGFGTGSLYIGGDNSSSAALINEVSVWRRALGPSEISRLYSAGIAGMDVPGYSGTVQRSSSPTEPLALIDTTLQNLEILQAFYNSPPPVPIMLPSSMPGGTGLQLQVLGEPGMNYILQSSSDLRNWQPQQSNILESAVVQIPTGVATKAMFFRATQQPVQ